MKYKSVFDIIGPVMVGPSSSHTAGAARIGRIARGLFGRQPKKVDVTFYGSFAKTYQGHGSDVATVAGILDFDTFDTRLKESLRIAKEQGIDISLHVSEAVTEHPNTSRIRLEDEQGATEVVGVSIGGGKIEITEIDGFAVQLGFNTQTLMVLHEDRFGMIAAVAKILSERQINIGSMEVSRHARGSKALMAIEVDSVIAPDILEQMERIPSIYRVSLLSPS
ncbi:L-serine ammonia-lyase, iron-sulfur-dependent, subunit beta [Brevibacillus fluminis]|uniref:L-serine deaminase n=1 Tax=Brevibacillus fluminis TaxID=511487 RepID=A0A3M8DSV0_9BACL|nr:L-serine ammonia-lyase, iron-sulfur-dependent subunit beta [Brevibacillus fluminis]RNB91238.1 L-serine ammonia-lyase, iron-sulfur-dependent, subunit beta [Brevibacillus fluminis]